MCVEVIDMAGREEIGRAVEWWLQQVGGIGPKTMGKLDARLEGHFEALVGESDARIDAILADASVRRAARARVGGEEVRAGVARWRAEHDRLPADTRILHWSEDDYPGRLRALEDPPRFLYVRGRCRLLHAGQTVSVVGSRSATVDGVRQTREMAGAIGADGRVVVSGGAIGVDAAAHRGALEAGGDTVVVLPGGVGRPSPAKNSHIFDRALENGCLISEYPLGTDVRKFQFHRRNRLIAALGDWLLVVRAGQHSGTMITARAAAELGRPVLAMAGGMEDARFAGCVDLLAAGARCVRGARDLSWVLASLEPSAAKVEPGMIERDRDEAAGGEREPEDNDEPAGGVDEALRSRLDGDSESLLALIEDGGERRRAHVDELRRRWGGAAAGLESALLQLELLGILEKVPGKNAYKVVK